MADRELRKNPAPIAAPMPMSWRCRPLRVREGCISAGILRESWFLSYRYYLNFTAIGLSVVSKAVVLLHVRLLLYLARQEICSCSPEKIVTQERPGVFSPNWRNRGLNRHLESSNPELVLNVSANR